MLIATRWKSLAWIGAASAAWVTVAGCNKAPAQQAAGPRESKPVEVRVTTVEHRSVPRSIDLTGTLYGDEEVTIASKSNGRIVRLDVDLGDEITPGQTLAQIEQVDFELALAERRAAVQASLSKLGLGELPSEEFDLSKLPTVQRARAEEANAKAKFERAKQLFEQSPPLISAQDFADIRTQWEVSSRSAEVELLTAGAVLAEARTQAAAVAIAQRQLAETTVTAPAPMQSGPPRYGVAERRVSVGELVTAGQPLFRLVASDRIKFRGSVPERFTGRVAKGQPVTLRVEASTTAFPAVVTRVSPQIDRAARSFEVEIQADNSDGRLKPGAFGRASIVTTTDENVAFVPTSAVVTFAGVEKVFGVEGGKAVERRVVTGVRDGDSVEIVGGLPLSTVVIDGASALTNGVAVAVVEDTADARRGRR